MNDLTYLDKLDRKGLLWELIRRNPEYNKLYAKYIVLKPKFDKLSLAEKRKNAKHRALLKKFRALGISYPLDPDKSARELGDTLDGRIPDADSVSCLFWDDDDDRSILLADVPRTGKRLAVLIDTTAPDKIIQNKIKKIVEWKRTERKLAIRDSRSEKRVRENDWPDYLKAYLLREDGHSLRSITDRLFPGHRHSADCDGCRKTRRHITAARRLINGQYNKFLPR